MSRAQPCSALQCSASGLSQQPGLVIACTRNTYTLTFTTLVSVLFIDKTTTSCIPKVRPVTVCFVFFRPRGILSNQSISLPPFPNTLSDSVNPTLCHPPSETPPLSVSQHLSHSAPRQTSRLAEPPLHTTGCTISDRHRLRPQTTSHRIDQLSTPALAF